MANAGTSETVLYREVSLIQRLSNTLYMYSDVLQWDENKCPQWRSALYSERP